MTCLSCSKGAEWSVACLTVLSTESLRDTAILFAWSALTTFLSAVKHLQATLELLVLSVLCMTCTWHKDQASFACCHILLL